MSLKQALRERPAAAIALALVLLVLAVVAGYAIFGTNVPTYRRAFYYQPQTDQLFTGGAWEGVISGADGPAYRAAVFGCGSCAPEDRFVAWLERPAEDAADAPVVSIADPDVIPPHWVDVDAPEADAIRTAARDRCADDPSAAEAIRCTPDSPAPQP